MKCAHCNAPHGKRWWQDVPGLNGDLCLPCHDAWLAARIPAKIVLAPEAFDKLSAELENPRPPTEALRELFGSAREDAPALEAPQVEESDPHRVDRVLP